MIKNVSILGLGKIGLSIGLALGRHVGQYKRTGFNPRSMPVNKHLQKQGLDKIERKSSNCVKNADVVFICLPTDLMEDTINDISPHVGTDTLIISTSPAKTAAALWLEKKHSTKINFVGVEFLFPPKYEQELNETGNISSELFENVLTAIAAPDNTDPEVINQAADLVQMLGATPFFCDLLEMEGMVSSTQVLPQLVSAAFLNATTGSPGWRDAGKFAGQEFADTSSSIGKLSEGSGLSQTAISLKDHLIRGLDSVLISLNNYKTALSTSNSDQLEVLLEMAIKGRQKWWHDRTNPENAGIEPPPVKVSLSGEHWQKQSSFLNILPKKKPNRNG